MPRWCRQARQFAINGKDAGGRRRSRLSLHADRADWNDGDAVRCDLPMAARRATWAKNQNAVSVNYGPLTFSLKIGEQWSRFDGHRQVAGLGSLPHDALELRTGAGREGPGKVVRVAAQARARFAPQPFTPGSVPIELRVKARRIPNWTLNGRGLIGMLQPSPVRSDEPLETVTLIPMGAARLRISAFPTIGGGPAAHDWVEPPDFRASASYVLYRKPPTPSATAVNLPVPTTRRLPRFTWWPHSGTTGMGAVRLHAAAEGLRRGSLLVRRHPEGRLPRAGLLATALQGRR